MKQSAFYPFCPHPHFIPFVRIRILSLLSACPSACPSVCPYPRFIPTPFSLPMEAVTMLQCACRNATIPATLSIIFIVTPPLQYLNILQSDGCTAWVSDEAEYSTLCSGRSPEFLPDIGYCTPHGIYMKNIMNNIYQKLLSQGNAAVENVLERVFHNFQTARKQKDIACRGWVLNPRPSNY